MTLHYAEEYNAGRETWAPVLFGFKPDVKDGRLKRAGSTGPQIRGVVAIEVADEQRSLDELQRKYGVV